MRSRIIILLLMTMLSGIALSQTHGGVEQYYYAGQKGISAIVPKLYYQNKKNWYGELRYNYDENETFSVNIGKTFSNENKFSYSVTPMLGLIAGKFNGSSLGLNIESDFKNIFFSAESQYSFSSQRKNLNYFFNWSELYYEMSDHFYGGMALQLTGYQNIPVSAEPGLMLGLSFNKVSFPVYVFNPGSKSNYFVLGINIEWNTRSSKVTKKEIPYVVVQPIAH